MDEENKKYLEITNSVFRIVLTAIFTLIPWVFLPVINDFYEGPKSIFLIITATILFCLVSAKAIFKKKLVVYRSLFDLFVLALLIVSIGSTILSQDPLTSFLGYSTTFSGGLVATFFFIVFYFSIINGIEDTKDYQYPIKGFLFSMTIFSIFLIIQYLNGYIGFLNPLYENLADTLGFISADFFTKNSFNTIGSSNLIPFILLMILPVVSNNYFSENSKTSLAATLVNILAISLATSSLTGFYVAIVPIFFIFIIAIYTYFYSNKIKEIVPKIAVVSIIFSISFIFFNTELRDNFGLQQYTTTEILSIEEGINITNSSLTSSLKNTVIGGGLDTFPSEFTKYKSSDYSQTEYWNLTFTRNTTQFLEQLVEGGVLLVLVYIFIGIYLLYFLFKNIILSKFLDSKVDVSVLGFSILPIIVILSSLIIYFNFFIWFLFWGGVSLSMGSFYLLNKDKTSKFELDLDSKNGTGFLVPQMSLAFGVILLFVVLVLVAKHTYSEVNLREAINYANKANLAVQIERPEAACENYRNAIRAMDSAHKNINYKDYIDRNYALISYNFGEYLFNLEKAELKDTYCIGEKPSSYYFSLAEVSLKGSIDGQFIGALVLDDNNIENIRTGVKIYSSLINVYSENSEFYSEETAAFLLESVKKDPYNPDNWLDLGILLYSAASNIEESNLNLSFDYVELANVYFERALELRPNYLRTVLVIAQANLTYDRKEEALLFLESVNDNFDNDEDRSVIADWLKTIREEDVFDSNTNFENSNVNINETLLEDFRGIELK